MVADAWSSWTEPVSVQRCPELEAGSVSSGGSALGGGSNHRLISSCLQTAFPDISLVWEIKIYQGWAVSGSWYIILAELPPLPKITIVGERDS